MEEEEHDKQWRIEEGVEDELMQVSRFYVPMRNLSKPVSLFRAIFEFAIPIIISVYAIIALLKAPV